MEKGETTKVHCNSCFGDRNHDVLHVEKTEWINEEDGNSGGEFFETLKCLGCDSIKLRHSSWDSEHSGYYKVTYFPPAVSRREPEWLSKALLQEWRLPLRARRSGKLFLR